MKKIKNLLFIVLLAFLFVEVLIIFPSKLEHENASEVRARVAIQERENKEKLAKIKRGEKIEEPSNLAGQKLKGVHLVESKEGRRDWELFSASAEGNQGMGKWNLKDVRILFYKNEKVEFVVTGRSGTIDSKSKDLSVVGGVETRSENGYLFQTPAVFYSSKNRKIESPDRVLMKGPSDGSGEGMMVKGRKMKVLVDESKMLIQDEVVAQKQEKNGKSFEISAGGAEFSGKNREVLFKGKVKLAYDRMKLEGPEASFLYKTGTEILSSIALKGGVRVSDSDKYATSESVNLDLLANKFVLKGRPLVIQNGDELSGDEIIFLEGGKKVKVEKVRAKVENKD